MKSFWLIASSVVMFLLSACRGEDSVDANLPESYPFEDSFSSYLIQFDADCPCYDVKSATRSTVTREWEDGETVYLVLSNAGEKRVGKAIYSKATDDWTMVIKGQLETGENQKCSVYYFKGGDITTNSNDVPNSIYFDKLTAIYADREALYSMRSDYVYISAALHPDCSRFAFKGNPGAQFLLRIREIDLLSEFSLEDESYMNNTSNDIIRYKYHMDIKRTGYSDYIYVRNSSQIDGMFVTIDNILYSHSFDANSLAVGQSGYFKLPEKNNYYDWIDEREKHEYVDLGLPSGLLWATCNVGAVFPEEYGDYFAWGETEAKATYWWSNYKWCNGTLDSITKYYTSSGYGSEGDKTMLDPEDDVAHMKWGGTWRMPTKSEQDELRNNCSWSRTMQVGIWGYKVTGSNGNSIFLPAAGYCLDNSLEGASLWGMYWSSTLHTKYNYMTYYLNLEQEKQFSSIEARCYGLSVRPVCQ